MSFSFTRKEDSTPNILLMTMLRCGFMMMAQSSPPVIGSIDIWNNMMHMLLTLSNQAHHQMMLNLNRRYLLHL